MEQAKSDLAQVVRLALSEQVEDVRLFVARLVRKYRSSDPSFAEEMDMHLRSHSPKAASAMRKKTMSPAAEHHPVPADDESRLSLLKVFEDSPDREKPLLAPELRQQFYGIVREMQAAGTTVLLSSHALNELEGNAGRVVILNEGLKIADGSLDELRRIARLPTRIRLTAAEGGARRLREWMGEPKGLRQINGHIVEIDASPEDKAAFLRRAAGEGAPFEDLDMVPPGLDELYAHFLAGRASQ